MKGGNQGRSGCRHNKIGTRLGEASAWSSKDVSMQLPLLPTQESWKSALQELLGSGPGTPSSSKHTTTLPFPSLALSFLQWYTQRSSIANCRARSPQGCCSSCCCNNLPPAPSQGLHRAFHTLPSSNAAVFLPSSTPKLQFPSISRMLIACNTSGQLWGIFAAFCGWKQQRSIDAFSLLMPGSQAG